MLKTGWTWRWDTQRILRLDILSFQTLNKPQVSAEQTIMHTLKILTILSISMISQNEAISLTYRVVLQKFHENVR